MELAGFFLLEIACVIVVLRRRAALESEIRRLLAEQESLGLEVRWDGPGRCEVVQRHANGESCYFTPARAIYRGRRGTIIEADRRPPGRGRLVART